MSLLLAELLGESQIDMLIPKEMLKEQSQDHTLTLILITNGKGYYKTRSFQMFLDVFIDCVANLFVLVSTYNFNFHLKGKLQGEQRRWF